MTGPTISYWYENAHWNIMKNVNTEMQLKAQILFGHEQWHLKQNQRFVSLMNLFDIIKSYARP